MTSQLSVPLLTWQVCMIVRKVSLRAGKGETRINSSCEESHSELKRDWCKQWKQWPPLRLYLLWSHWNFLILLRNANQLNLHSWIYYILFKQNSEAKPDIVLCKKLTSSLILRVTVKTDHSFNISIRWVLDIEKCMKPTDLCRIRAGKSCIGASLESCSCCQGVANLANKADKSPASSAHLDCSFMDFKIS